MLEENKKKLDSISRKKDLQFLLFPLTLIAITTGLFYFAKLYEVEYESTYTTGLIVSRNALISKYNNHFICNINLQTGETIQTRCYKYRKIGEVVRVEKRITKGLFTTTTDFYDF